MKTRIIPLLICILAISAQVAQAGPANRRAVATGNPPNVPINLNGFGAPLPGVTSNASDLADFASGQMNFKEVETLPQVGPLMNGVSCAGCHSHPAIGGGGLFIHEIRVPDNNTPGPGQILPVENLLRNGPQTQGKQNDFRQGMEAEPLVAR